MSTAPMPLVQVFSPDGQLGDIPWDKLQSAVAAGAKPAVKIKAPDGSIGYVPAGKEREAQAAGGQIIPYDIHSDADGEKPGFWANLGQGLKNIAGGMANMPFSPAEVAGNIAPQAAQEGMNIAARQSEGRSPVYNAAATGAEIAGIPARQMEEAANRGDTAGVMGAAAAPLVPAVAGAAIGAGAERFSKTELPERMYQSSLKPSTVLKPEVRARLVETGLSEGIPVSEFGAEKLSGLLEDLQDNVKSTIAQNPNAPINKFAVASRLGRTAQRAAMQVNPETDLAAISQSGNEFLRNQPTEIPATQAQELKVGTYKQLGEKAYGELQTATKESQKALARGLKEELENVFPEIKAMNAREGKLYDLEGVLNRAIGRIDNRDLLGIGTPIAAGAGEAITGSAKAGAAVGILKAVFDNPTLKSKLAIMLSDAGKITPKAASAKLAAYAAALGAASRQNGGQSNEP